VAEQNLVSHSPRRNVAGVSGPARAQCLVAVTLTASVMLLGAGAGPGLWGFSPPYAPQDSTGPASATPTAG
jgi:hypothetical protein